MPPGDAVGTASRIPDGRRAIPPANRTCRPDADRLRHPGRRPADAGLPHRVGPVQAAFRPPDPARLDPLRPAARDASPRFGMPAPAWPDDPSPHGTGVRGQGRGDRRPPTGAALRKPRATVLHPPARPVTGARSAALAQLVRALDCGSRGPPFKPGRRYHFSPLAPDLPHRRAGLSLSLPRRPGSQMSGVEAGPRGRRGVGHGAIPSAIRPAIPPFRYCMSPNAAFSRSTASATRARGVAMLKRRKSAPPVPKVGP